MVASDWARAAKQTAAALARVIGGLLVCHFYNAVFCVPSFTVCSEKGIPCDKVRVARQEHGERQRGAVQYPPETANIRHGAHVMPPARRCESGPWRTQDRLAEPRTPLRPSDAQPSAVWGPIAAVRCWQNSGHNRSRLALSSVTTRSNSPQNEQRSSN